MSQECSLEWGALKIRPERTDIWRGEMNGAGAGAPGKMVEKEKQAGKDGKIREVCASSVIPRGNLIS